MTARAITNEALGRNIAGILQAATAATTHRIPTLFAQELASTVTRIQATMASVQWADVAEAHAGFVRTIQNLERDDNVVPDLDASDPVADPVEETRRDPLSRPEILLLISIALLWLSSQDDILSNARHNAQMVEQVISKLVDYLAMLIVWAGELPK